MRNYNCHLYGLPSKIINYNRLPMTEADTFNWIQEYPAPPPMPQIMRSFYNFVADRNLILPLDFTLNVHYKIFFSEEPTGFAVGIRFTARLPDEADILREQIEFLISVMHDNSI